MPLPPFIRMQQMPEQTPIENGFLIGNGSSRAGFDLRRLNGRGMTVGCNYVFKDYDPDYIVAIDEYIVDELKDWLREGHDHKWKFIARVYLDGRFWWLCADQEKVVQFACINHRLNQDSGILGAYFLANTMHARRVYLLGVDFYRPVESGAKDVYSEGIPEKPKIELAWNTLIADHPATEFIRVGDIADSDRDWYETKLKGMTFIPYADLPI